MKRRHYLDYNATAPMLPEARNKMIELLDAPLNASSVHGEGRAARKAMETAREQVAALVDSDAKAVTFVSSGTEANNTVLSLSIQIGSNTYELEHLFVSAIEHPCVLAGGRFAKEAITHIPVTKEGAVDLAELESLLEPFASNDSEDSLNSSEEGPPAPRFMVSVMLANNETGVIQPVREVADMVHGLGGIVHCDAVQAAGKIPLNIYDLGADVMTLSGHKIGGGLGAGAIVRAHSGLAFPPLHKGGGQELGARAGTENVSAIAAFGVAAGIAASNPSQSVMRDFFEREVKKISNQIEIVGESVERLPNTSCILLGEKSAETAIISYDMQGIAVSSGSACSSGKVGISHVLEAMGYEENRARSAIRISTGPETSEEDIEVLLAATRKMFS